MRRLRRGVSQDGCFFCSLAELLAPKRPKAVPTAAAKIRRIRFNELFHIREAQLGHLAQFWLGQLRRIAGSGYFRARERIVHRGLRRRREGRVYQTPVQHVGKRARAEVMRVDVRNMPSKVCAQRFTVREIPHEVQQLAR